MANCSYHLPLVLRYNSFSSSIPTRTNTRAKRPPTVSRWVYELSMGNRLSSAICSPSCSSMYSRIISSVMVPELTASYPRAHKCRPQNSFRRWANSCSRTRERIPFSHGTIWLTSWVGRYERNRGTWSRATFPDTISSSCSAAICRSRSRPIGNAARDHVTPILLRLTVLSLPPFVARNGKLRQAPAQVL
jgi:hypothetical protein